MGMDKREVQMAGWEGKLARVTIANRWSITGLYFILLVYVVGAAIRQEQVHPHFVDFDQFYFGATLPGPGIGVFSIPSRTQMPLVMPARYN